jgi:hypothetical protein
VSLFAITNHLNAKDSQQNELVALLREFTASMHTEPGSVHYSRNRCRRRSSTLTAPTPKAIWFTVTPRNFNPLTATAGRITIAEVEELVDGYLDPIRSSGSAQTFGSGRGLSALCQRGQVLCGGGMI